MQDYYKTRFRPKARADNFIRVYDVTSIVMHRGYRADEYVSWFLFYAVRYVLGPFYFNLDEYAENSVTYRDEILNEMEKRGLIAFDQ